MVFHSLADIELWSVIRVVVLKWVNVCTSGARQNLSWILTVLKMLHVQKFS